MRAKCDLLILTKGTIAYQMMLYVLAMLGDLVGSKKYLKAAMHFTWEAIFTTVRRGKLDSVFLLTSLGRNLVVFSRIYGYVASITVYLNKRHKQKVIRHLATAMRKLTSFTMFSDIWKGLSQYNVTMGHFNGKIWKSNVAGETTFVIIALTHEMTMDKPKLTSENYYLEIKKVWR